ncbi:hypothetical protein [uncultured Clostridium sp.]|uniref:hypothetical protein n=1 Tax=uncultured Clostridium sp. TaxID=59620 RepID=UPI0026196FFC|nr:hypothetical protein [uncultured Clostridium sp.]
MKKAVEEVIKLWKDATGEDIEEKRTKFRLSSTYDYILHEAMRCLDEDSTGLLTALKLRQAFKEFSSVNSLTVEDLLNGEWDELKLSMTKLKESLYSGIINDVYNKFVNSLLKNIKAFGKELTEEQFNNIKNIEDILVKAISNFNKPYELKHERFTEGELKKQNARILKRLFRFGSFEEFIDNLKVTNEDNFICVALCDRTFKENDNSDYDNKYDSQFAIGLKNNGVVISVSDRKVLESPSGEYKGRNPGREFWNKVDYSYLPYYKIEDIEDATEGKQQLCLTYKEEINSNDGQLVVDLFDDTGIVYITTILTLVYNKYFTHPETEKVTDLQFFGKDIKLLPTSNSKELMVVDGKLELPAVPKDSNYTTYQKDPEDKYGIYNHGLYDWLLEEYLIPDEELKMPIKFIGTKEEAQRNIWWQVRNKQHNYIQNKLKEDYNRNNIENWFKQQFEKNAESIINYIITTSEYDNLDKFNLSDDDKNNKPKVWKCYKNNIDIDLSSLKETGETHTYNYELKRYRFSTHGRHSCLSFNSLLGKVKVIYYRCCPILWFEDDNDQRYYELTLTLRTWGELKKFFNLNELPKSLKRWINMKAHDWSVYSWEPYQGNSLLNFTDPMNKMKIPQNDISFYIKLNISKTMYNKIQKLHKNR